jgi:hypothetical protein
MGIRRYVSEYMILSLRERPDDMTAMRGVSIIVRNPLDISDIVLAIFFLSMVNSSLKKRV